MTLTSALALVACCQVVVPCKEMNGKKTNDPNLKIEGHLDILRYLFVRTSLF